VLFSIFRYFILYFSLKRPIEFDHEISMNELQEQVLQ
jgi:hypothetical protein